MAGILFKLVTDLYSPQKPGGGQTCALGGGASGYYPAVGRLTRADELKLFKLEAPRSPSRPRQELGLERWPTMEQVWVFAEHLQAEAEELSELSLAAGGKRTSSTSTTASLKDP